MRRAAEWRAATDPPAPRHRPRHSAAGGWTVASAPRAAADEALEAVVDHHQLEHRVALGAAGIGPPVLRREIEGDRPGQRHDHECDACRGHPAEPLPPAEPARQPPARQQGRAADQRRQHLDVEGDAEQRHRRRRATGRGRATRPARPAAGRSQPGVGVVGAVDRDRDRRDAPQQRGDQPALRPNGRRTSRYSSATEATPASACGRWIDQPLKPSSQAKAAWIQKATGGLSSEMKPAGSKEL